MDKTITDHADKRMRKRCGINRKAIEKNAETALDKGLSRKDCTGKLAKYMDYLFLSHNNGADIRLWSNHVYIFTRERLVTVLPLPNQYKNMVIKALKRKTAAQR